MAAGREAGQLCQALSAPDVVRDLTSQLRTAADVGRRTFITLLRAYEAKYPTEFAGLRARKRPPVGAITHVLKPGEMYMMNGSMHGDAIK
jgi:hypothetical protein